jgi:hypothetical protein
MRSSNHSPDMLDISLDTESLKEKLRPVLNNASSFEPASATRLTGKF